MLIHHYQVPLLIKRDPLGIDELSFLPSAICITTKPRACHCRDSTQSGIDFLNLVTQGIRHIDIPARADSQTLRGSPTLGPSLLHNSRAIEFIDRIGHPIRDPDIAPSIHRDPRQSGGNKRGGSVQALQLEVLYTSARKWHLPDSHVGGDIQIAILSRQKFWFITAPVPRKPRALLFQH